MSFHESHQIRVDAGSGMICSRCYRIEEVAPEGDKILWGDDLADALEFRGWEIVPPFGWCCKGCKIVSKLQECGEIHPTLPGLLAGEIYFVD